MTVRIYHLFISFRANATIEGLLYRCMTAANTAKWLDFLDPVVKTYNTRSQKSLHGLCPLDAHRKENESWLRKKYLEDYARFKAKFAKRRPKFKIGDTVRIAKDRTAFGPRGYEPSTHMEQAEIADVIFTAPITYKLKDKQRKYYENELAFATPIENKREKHYFIEKTRIVNAKRLRSGNEKGGEKQYLLKAKNDPDQSSWITQAEYQSLKDGGLLME